jgi:outer membrane protein assembly factor BamB
MRRLVLLSFVVGGCGPAPLGAPCPPLVESATPEMAPAASGGVFVYGPEGLPEGTFLHRFDAAGALAWTVTAPPLADPLAYRAFFAVGDTLFSIEEKHISGYIFAAIRDGAIVFTVDAPYDCRLYRFETEPDGDGLRVYGTGSDHLCSYRIGADGTFSDLLAFDVAGAYQVRRAPSGGYLLTNGEGVIRYDAGAQRLWTHAGHFASALESAGAIFAFRDDDPGETLVSIGSDGQGERALTAILGGDTFTAPLADGLLVAAQEDYGDARQLVRVTPAAVVWSQSPDALAGAPVAGLSLGTGAFVVRGHQLLAYDLDGNLLWRATRPVAAVMGADDRARVADDALLDPCRAVLRVSTLDESGNVAASWSAR